MPTQARSRGRVADILKAAGVLLGEVGYDGLSTNLIAERADVPVGSIYQFFEARMISSRRWSSSFRSGSSSWWASSSTRPAPCAEHTGRS